MHVRKFREVRDRESSEHEQKMHVKSEMNVAESMQERSMIEDGLRRM